MQPIWRLDAPECCSLAGYISVSAVTATGGFAFTASHLEKPQVTKGSCPAIRCLAVALLRGRLPRHSCRGAPYATPAFGLWERGKQIKIKSQSKINSSRHPLIVPTLCVGMHPVTLRVTLAQDSSLASTAERGASLAAFPRRAWERSRKSCEHPLFTTHQAER